MFKINCIFCAILLILQSCNTSVSNNDQDPEVKQDSLIHITPNKDLDDYWRKYNFKSGAYLNDNDQAEQHIVDFIALLPGYSISEIDDAMAALYQEIKNNIQVRDFFLDKFEFYLYHPNSPMLNELYYESFLKAVVQDNNLNSVIKQKYTSLLKLVGLNKPGSMVSDFTFYTSEDQKEMLSDSHGTLRLLLFYDLTCTHCAEIINVLSESSFLNQSIAAGKLSIIAIEPLATMTDWMLYGANIPKNWIHGINKNQFIIKYQLFNLRAYPSIYLIGEDGRVILRDVEVNQAIDFIVKYK